MNIGITLNEVVRDFTTTVGGVYEEYIDSVNGMLDMNVSDMSETPLDAKDGSFVMNKIQKNNDRILLNLEPQEDLFNISSKYEFEDIEEYNTFLYEDLAFQIFSRGNLIYPEAMMDLNSFYSQLVSDGNSVTIVSQERKNSKPATLLFLSQNKFQCNNIKFLDNYSKIWELYDLVITANPYIIATKPKNKLCFKINSEDNIELSADMSFDSLLDAQTFYKTNKKR